MKPKDSGTMLLIDGVYKFVSHQDAYQSAPVEKSFFSKLRKSSKNVKRQLRSQVENWLDS